MTDFFKKIKGTKNVLAVYYKDDGSFSTGFVEETDDEFLCMKFLSPCGRFDGWHLIRSEEILKADYGTNYLNNLGKVYAHYAESEINFKIYSKDLLQNFCDFLIKNKWICTMELGFETLEKISGYIVERDWNTLEVRLINEDGQDDGYTSFDTDDIVYIGAKSEFELYLETLRELNFSKQGNDEAKIEKVSRREKKKLEENIEEEKSILETKSDQNQKKNLEREILSFPTGKEKK